jgi:hypothetical protein
MSELKVNKVTPRSGTTVTIGDSGEHLALAGNIGLGGATPTTSGTGITFPATASGSTDANTLDDYEEGTWTFAVTPTTGSVTMGTNNLAFYRKIGSVVMVGAQVGVGSVSSPTGAIVVTLPFSVKSVTKNEFGNNGSIIAGGSVSKNANGFAVLAIPGSSEMRIYIADGSNISSGNANAQQLQTSTDIYFQLNYVT